MAKVTSVAVIAMLLSFYFVPINILADTGTNDPTANTGAAWTNPTNAYADGTSAATQTSGSATNTYTTYGFALTGTVTQVRVKTDAWCTTSSTTTSKNPTANTNGAIPWTNPVNAYTSEGTYATAGAATSQTSRPMTPDIQDTCSSTKSTGTTFWGLVDEAVVSDADFYTMVAPTAGGHNVYTGSAFTVPANSTIQNLTIYYRAGNTASALCNVRASILTGTTYRDTTDAGVDPSDSPAYTTYSYAFTTNPATGAAWTYDEVNATDATTAHRLNGYGTASSDLNPDINVSWVYAVCNYIPIYDHIYGTFAITDPGTSTTVTKVEIGYEAFATATQKLDFYTSANGGSAWSSMHQSANLATSDPNAYTYIDVTSDQTWTWTLLGNGNFKVKMTTNWINGTPTWSVDALIVRVTYVPLTNDQIRVAVTWDGGSTWSSNYDTTLNGSEQSVWSDVTAATAWTFTKLNNTNFQVRVNSVTVGDTSTINLDWIPVEVTYTTSPAITDNPGTKGWGTVNLAASTSTTINYFTITNTGDCDVSITIQGTDFTGGDDTWDLSDDATNGDNIFGIKAGLDDADDLFDIIVKEIAAVALVADLPLSSTQSWGLWILMPSAVTGYNNQQMTSVITLVASAYP